MRRTVTVELEGKLADAFEGLPDELVAKSLINFAKDRIYVERRSGGRAEQIEEKNLDLTDYEKEYYESNQNKLDKLIDLFQTMMKQGITPSVGNTSAPSRKERNDKPISLDISSLNISELIKPVEGLEEEEKELNVKLEDIDDDDLAFLLDLVK